MGEVGVESFHGIHGDGVKTADIRAYHLLAYKYLDMRYARYLKQE